MIISSKLITLVSHFFYTLSSIELHKLCHWPRLKRLLSRNLRHELQDVGHLEISFASLVLSRNESGGLSMNENPSALGGNSWLNAGGWMKRNDVSWLYFSHKVPLYDRKRGREVLVTQTRRNILKLCKSNPLLKSLSDFYVSNINFMFRNLKQGDDEGSQSVWLHFLTAACKLLGRRLGLWLLYITTSRARPLKLGLFPPTSLPAKKTFTLCWSGCLLRDTWDKKDQRNFFFFPCRLILSSSQHKTHLCGL